MQNPLAYMLRPDYPTIVHKSNYHLTKNNVNIWFIQAKTTTNS